MMVDFKRALLYHVPRFGPSLSLSLSLSLLFSFSLVFVQGQLEVNCCQDHDLLTLTPSAWLHLCGLLM